MNDAGDTVHVVDDDAAIRESLSFLLDTAGLKACLYESGHALLARTGALEPGCIITDVRMPEMNGLELVERLKESGVRLPVIVLTGHADVAMAVEAMKAGVIEFLEKPFSDDALLRAVDTAMAVGKQAQGRDAERAELQRRLAELTAREREVFDAIVAGDSNKAAGLKLGISPRTVEIYRANVMTKMQAHSLSELVRMALALERA
ncbi:MAG: response regulator [Hyphomonadaceae bacterium]|nr:response regulator [Hyphomonadaceae bacterium]